MRLGAYSFTKGALPFEPFTIACHHLGEFAFIHNAEVDLVWTTIKLALASALLIWVTINFLLSSLPFLQLALFMARNSLEASEKSLTRVE